MMLQTSEDQVYQPHVILRGLAYEQEKPEERDRNFRLFLKSGKHHCIQYQFVFCWKYRSILIIAIPICMTSQKNVTSALEATFDRDQKSPRIPPPPAPPPLLESRPPTHAHTLTHLKNCCSGTKVQYSPSTMLFFDQRQHCEASVLPSQT